MIIAEKTKIKTKIKICGLNDESAVHAVIKAGADYAGFVNYPKSPRHISISKAVQLKSLLPESIKSVMVLVNPSDELLVEISSEMQPDFFQLHGNETPERLVEIRTKFPQIKTIKAISVRDSGDIKIAEDFYETSNFLLFDAKPTGDNMMHGGNGISFDWNILVGKAPKKNWFLAGGLNAQNITQAIKISGAKMIDVSSGVESSAGVKDARMIEEFVRTVRE
jgi:phosphoribosylanthranilate isomerase